MACVCLQDSFLGRNETEGREDVERSGARDQKAGWKVVGESKVYDPDSEKCSSLINIVHCWKG